MSTQKDKGWDYALGIIKVDGLEPSPELIVQVLENYTVEEDGFSR